MLLPTARHTPVVYVTVFFLLIALAFTAFAVVTVVSVVAGMPRSPRTGLDPRPNLPGPGIDPATGMPWGFGPSLHNRSPDTTFADNGVPTHNRVGPDYDPHGGGHDPHRRPFGPEIDNPWGNNHGSGAGTLEGSSSYSGPPDTTSSYSDSSSSFSDAGSSSSSSGSD